MNTKKLLYGVLGGATLIAVSMPLLAGSGRCAEGRHSGHLMSDRMISRISDRLELEDSQRDALFAAADKARPQMREARRELRDSRRELKELDASASDYRTQVAALADRRGELAKQMTLLAADMKSEMAAILTDEQMEKFSESMEKRGHHRRGKGN